jgi:tetratricopeptide (TPR) repeat protein
MMTIRTLIAALLCVSGTLAAQQDQAAAAFAQGKAAHAARKTEEAVKAFEKAVELDAGNWLYHMWLGHAYTRHLANVNFIRKASLGKKAGAEYNRAVELAPQNIEAAESRMDFLLNAPGIVGGGVDKALAEARRIRTLSSYRGGFALARIAEKEGEDAKAETEYRTLMRDHPDSSAPAMTLAAFLQNKTRFPEAFAVIDARLARFPNDTSANYQLGRAAALSGRELSRGEIALRKFLSLVGAGQPQWSANGHYRLGMIREKQGDVAAARVEYQRAVELVPSYEEAKAALKKLER